jgi:ketosteroid isomerase-like protein
MMTEDGVFETYAGPEPYGTRHQGRAALRAAFSVVFEAFPDASWNDARHVVSGDRGFSEWIFRGTDHSGNKVEVRGVDVFTFRDGRIARKDTFRKTRIK